MAPNADLCSMYQWACCNGTTLYERLLPLRL